MCHLRIMKPSKRYYCNYSKNLRNMAQYFTQAYNMKSAHDLNSTKRPQEPRANIEILCWPENLTVHASGYAHCPESQCLAPLLWPTDEHSLYGHSQRQTLAPCIHPAHLFYIMPWHKPPKPPDWKIRMNKMSQTTQIAIHTHLKQIFAVNQTTNHQMVF